MCRRFFSSLLALLVSVPNALGYQVGIAQPYAKSRSRKQRHLRRQEGNNNFVVLQPSNPIRGPTPPQGNYDLGLGKNLPVGMSSQSFYRPKHNVVSQDASAATKYLVEHHATRDYPSPYHNKIILESAKVKTGTHSTTEDVPIISRLERKSKLDRVQPKRVLEDVLVISKNEDHDDGSGRDHGVIRDNIPPGADTEQTTMVLSDSHKLDVNTVWVEMLLHDQLEP